MSTGPIRVSAGLWSDELGHILQITPSAVASHKHTHAVHGHACDTGVINLGLLLDLGS